MIVSNEAKYWADKAALLDPACYQYYIGRDWSVTVPEGRVWYAVNVWQVRLPGSSNLWHHRSVDADDAIQLPPGFTMSSIARLAFAYWADPTLVQHDARYSTDPKGLYYERLNKLRAIPLESISINRPAGTPGSAGESGVAFPLDFKNAIIRHVDCFNGAWVILAGNYRPDGTMDVSNTQDELDDARPMRFSSSLMLPFNRALWNGFWLEHGVLNGDPSQPSTFDAYGSMLYQRLPEDW